MADAIISSVLEQLISTMAQEIKQEVRLVTGVSKEVKKLTNNLRAIQAVLVDAEQRQVKEQSVRLWVDQLKEAAYAMEDLLDEWNTARLKLQIKGEDGNNSVFAPKKKVCGSLFAFPCLCFKQVGLHHNIAVKIKDINENLDGIANMKNMFNFHVNEVKRVEEKPKRVQSTSIIDESKICGRENEKNTLISKLLCESSTQQENLHIISIVGMGGIGKTTLAQLAYNNEEVKKDFHKIIWVCVSDLFDEFRVAKAIIGDSTFNSTELEPLMQFVREYITGKKFLLVLDDVWNEEYCKWEPFYNCLKNGLSGSKILITTRKEIVARMMGSTDIIPIMQLAEEECWSLFRQLAFFGRSIEECEKLEQIGRKIAGKCKGLPLVAKIMGSLLRSKKSEIEWQRILDSELWKLEEMEKGLLPALLLSYNELHPVIKQCFSYCAVFPKDYKISKDELVRLWMAQGYLGVQQDEEMELIGGDYFDILATRSFFQEFRKDEEGNIEWCKMHDIVHDFAQFLCKNECFSYEISSSDEGPVTKPFSENVRHLMLRPSKGKASFPVSIFKVKKLHSLIIEGAVLESETVKKLCCELSCLRTFHMVAVYNVITEISTEVGKMIHLRYLNLSRQNIGVLPDTLCELYNLQILNVSKCRRLKELPQGIGKLRNLRELLNDGTPALSWMPAGIGRLTSLRTLKKFVVGGGSQGCSLETLKSLNLLRGECRIEGLGNVLLDEAERSQLEKKKNLWKLVLLFDGGRGEEEEEEERKKKDEEVLGALQPPPNLKKLVIHLYRGNNFRSWKWIMSLTNLTSLSLRGCINCEHLPALGKLPSLEELYIYGFNSVRRVGNEVLGIESDDTSSSSSSVIAFPKLKSLEFWYMNELEEWHIEVTRYEGEIMPRLSNLNFYNCPKLKALPDYILRIKTLETLRMSYCSILKERYEKERGDDWLKISHIPYIEIYGIQSLRGTSVVDRRLS